MKFLMMASLAIAMYSCNTTPVPAAPTSKVRLHWLASTTPNVSYRVYRGTVHNGPYTMIAQVPGLLYFDNTAKKHSTYYYVARSWNGMESGDSNEITIQIP